MVPPQEAAVYPSLLCASAKSACNPAAPCYIIGTETNHRRRYTPMKITILDGAVENPGDLSWEALDALGDLTVYDYTAPEEILPRIGDAPIILTNKTPITRQTMDECPNLRYIGVLATGFNVIDIAAAKEKGIVVANVPSYGTQAVAQFVMAQLLEICHRIGHHNDAAGDIHIGRK